MSEKTTIVPTEDGPYEVTNARCLAPRRSQVAEVAFDCSVRYAASVSDGNSQGARRYCCVKRLGCVNGRARGAQCI